MKKKPWIQTNYSSHLPLTQACKVSARPARTWFIQKNDSNNKPTLKPRNVGIDNKVKLASKIAKRYQKPKRLRVFGEEGKNKIVKKKAVKQIEKVVRNFDKQGEFNKFSKQKKKWKN